MKHLVSSAAKWREDLNPLRGLTIARAVQLLESGQRGEYADLQWTYEFIESSDPVLLALCERRTSAICEMDYNIQLVDEDTRNFDPVLANEQKDALSEAYERIDNLYEAIEHFEMAAFRGFAHCNPQRDPQGNLVHLEPLDPWNFCRDGRYGPWYWNPEALTTSARSLGAAARLGPQDLMTHEVRRSIDRIGLVKYARANLSEKDWDAYIEIYGIPAAFIILPPNTADNEDTYMLMAERAANGGSGGLPNGSDVKFANEARGTQPFDLRLDWLNKQLVLAGTGGLLTMLAESGSGTLAGGAHADTFRMIARARAKKLSELFQRRIDRAVLAAAFPDRPRLAYWELASEEEQDTGAQVEQIAKLAPYYLIDPADVTERTGLKIDGYREQAQPGAEFGVRSAESALLAANRQPATRNPKPSTSSAAEAVHTDLIAAAEAQLAAAQQQHLKPVAEALAAIYREFDDEDTPDERLTERLEEFVRDDLPRLFDEIGADGATRAVLADTFAAAFVNGAAEEVAT